MSKKLGGFVTFGGSLAEGGAADARVDALEVTENLLTCTALTGGAAGALDRITTTTLTANQVWATVNASDVTYFYYLDVGTDAESSPTVIRPDDYAGTTNEKVWKLANVRAGMFSASDGSAASPGFSFGSEAATGMRRTGSSAATMSVPSNDIFSWGRNSSENRLVMNADGAIGWASSSATITAIDTKLYRDAANTLAQRNGVNAQKFSLYGTFTDTGNYQRAAHSWSGTDYILSLESAGTGSAAGQLHLKPGSSGHIRLYGGANFIAQVNSSGLMFGADNTYDIGATGATRPRTLYLGSDLHLGTTGSLNWTSRGTIQPHSDGVFSWRSWSGSDFNRLQLGGTTASFPAIKRSGATIQTRLADDSDFAAAQSLYQRFGSGSPEGVIAAPVGAIYHRTDGGTGTAFYVKETGTTTSSGWVAK